MKIALIGYTGLVGQNILDSLPTDHQIYRYNTVNIDEIDGKEFDLVINAGVSGTKWLANKDPDTDFDNIQNLKDHLATIKTHKMIHISTVDVYSIPNDVFENSITEIQGLHAYGVHRLELELWMTEKFPNISIIRLPGIYGKGLKKNAIYDLIHKHELEKLNKNASYQWFHLKNISTAISFCIHNNIKLLNVATEPVTIKEIMELYFPDLLDQVPETETTVDYAVKTIYSPGDYLYEKDQVLDDLREYIEESRV